MITMPLEITEQSNLMLQPAPAILSPTLAAKVVHEGLGHMAEGDCIGKNINSGALFNLPPLSPAITVVDYAHTAFGKAVPLPVYTDTEGTTAQDVTIIKNGKPHGVMTHKASAATLGLQPTGNANGGIVRMRNTALLPGSSKLEAMLATIQYGYYLEDSLWDSADPAYGDFASHISKGYYIRNGTICEPLPPCIIHCEAKEFWPSVTMVGSDFAWITDECTKEDKKIMVAAGAPSIRCVVWIGRL